MKLYMHPVSTVSRPVRLLIAEKGLDVEEQVIDLMSGEHHQEPFASINPSRAVPVLEDGDFTLTESSAILKYLADKFDLPEYPKDLQARARVNEVMDWINTGLCRDLAYGMVYPQIFPHHKRASDAGNADAVAWGKGNADKWLGVMDSHWLGRGNPWLAGTEITIADYFAAGFVSLGEVVRCDFSKYPNVAAWLGRMKALKSWDSVNEVLYGFAGSVKDQQFVAV